MPARGSQLEHSLCSVLHEQAAFVANDGLQLVQALKIMYERIVGAALQIAEVTPKPSSISTTAQRSMHRRRLNLIRMQ